MGTECESSFVERVKRVSELLTPEILEIMANSGVILTDANEAKDTCVEKATEASTSATTASTKATEASTSATTASTKATEASTSATTASTKATEASTSATTASTKAAEASTSASIASTKATEASTSASIASTKAAEIEQYVIPEVAVGVATLTENGLLSSEDKSKLDGIEENANNYSHPTEEGSLHVPVKNETTTDKFLRGDGTWADLPTSTSIIYQAEDPTVTTNPEEIGTTIVNTETGELFNCIDNASDLNKWVGQLGTRIGFTSDPLGDGSLIDRWDFDNTISSANNTTTSTSTGGVTYIDGRREGITAVHVDGTTGAGIDLMEITDQFTDNDFTLCFWAKTATDKALIADYNKNDPYGDGTYGAWLMLYLVQTGANDFLRKNGTDYSFEKPKQINDDNWHFISFRGEGTSFILTVDSASTTISLNRSDYPAGNRLFLGRFVDYSNLYENIGSYSEFKLFNRALTDIELETIKDI